ncbi:MAG: STAS domain-containing protein [Sulfitobacter sp.]
MTEPLTPEGKLDLSAIPALHQALLSQLGQDIVLDLGHVTQMGALCLQTCLAAAKDTRAAGQSFEIVNVPEVVEAQICSMGLTIEKLAEGTL